MDSRKDEVLKENALSISEIKKSQTYFKMQSLKDKGVSKNEALLNVLHDEDIKKQDNLKIGQLGMINRYLYDGISCSSHMSPEDIDKINELNKKVHFPSKFMFLMAHYGLRLKEVHVLLAPTGAGKSTLAKSLALEISKKMSTSFVSYRRRS